MWGVMVFTGAFCPIRRLASAIILDYSLCGPKGKPRIIHVETETGGEPEIWLWLLTLRPFSRPSWTAVTSRMRRTGRRIIWIRN